MLQLRIQELVRVGIRAGQFEQRGGVTVSCLRGDCPRPEGHGLGAEPVASTCAGSQVPSMASEGMYSFHDG